MESILSYSGKFRHYIVPEVTVLSNTSSRQDLLPSYDDDTNPIDVEVYRQIPKFNFYTLNMLEPVGLSIKVLTTSGEYFMVTEEEAMLYYSLHDGTIKLKTAKKYG